MWMLANCKNGVSSYEVARAVLATQKTAWFMFHRIRFAIHQGSINKMTGTVETDAHNMHTDERQRKVHGRHTVGKTIVLGMYTCEAHHQVEATIDTLHVQERALQR